MVHCAPNELDLGEVLLNTITMFFRDLLLVRRRNDPIALRDTLFQHFGESLRKALLDVLLQGDDVLVAFVEFFYCFERNMRHLEHTLLIYLVRKILIKWFLHFVFSLNLELLFSYVAVNRRNYGLLDKFFEIGHPLLYHLFVRCQSENHHESVEVLNPQKFASLFLAPILKQIREHFHVFIMNLRKRQILIIFNIAFWDLAASHSCLCLVNILFF